MAEDKELETFKLFNKYDQATHAKEEECVAAKQATRVKGYVGETASLCIKSLSW